MADKRLNFTTIVHETKKIPSFDCVKAKNTSYVKYGEDNNYPEYLWDLFKNSSQMSSIILQMKDYIIGNGIKSGYPLKIVNRKGESFNDMIEKVILSYLIYGGFAIQIIRNRLGEIKEINNLDFRFVRINEEEDMIYYSKEWNKSRRQPIVYPRYKIGSVQPNSVFYYKGKLTTEVYPIPTYISAITSIEISTQIPAYHLSNLCNSFNPSVLINFNNGGGLSESVMDEIEEKVNEKFSGTNNAGRILLSFNEDKEHATEMLRLPSDGNIDQYNSLAGNVEKDIYTAFRMNKILMGDSSDNTGFSKQPYIEAFALYQKSVIGPIQKEIEKIFNSLLGEGSLEFSEFVIDWSEYGSDENTSEIIE